MEDKPMVSVLMTAYNREKYIGEAIESVLASTYTNFELIVVDDRSSDTTVAIAQGFAANDDRVKVYINEKNLGDYPNRNKAASYATGKYLKYIDADDKILSDGLEYCAGEMEKYPEAGLGMFNYFNDDKGSTAKYFTPAEMIQTHFFTRQHLIVGPTGAIFRRATFEKIGGFDTRFGVASDMFFNICMAAEAAVILLPREFFFYRIHEGQEQNNPEGYLVNNYLLMNALFDEKKLPLSEQELNFLRKKNKKRLSVNLLRHFVQTKSFRSFNRVRIKCGYSYANLLAGFFY